VRPQPKVKTVRDAHYLKWIRTRPCEVCRKPPPSQSHHSESGGMSIVGSDHSAIPVCLDCHREIHQHSSKRGQWSKDELDAILSRLHSKFNERNNHEPVI
jgi:hypothetical protein